MVINQEKLDHRVGKYEKSASFLYRLERIPFIGSSAFTDLRLLLLLFPLWWFLGIEQFIWPGVLSWTLVKTFVRKKYKISISPLSILFFIFIGCQLLSALFIIEDFRYISWLRSGLMFASILFVMIIVENCELSSKQRTILIDSVLISIGIAALFGLAAELGVWRPQFKSMISYLLPTAIKNTSYGAKIVFRSLGRYSFFTGLGEYFRLDSLFLYPTLYGSALAYTIPVAIYRCFSPSKFWTQTKSIILLGALFINLIYSTSRTAMISLIIGGIVFIVFISQYKNKNRIIIFIGFAFFLGLLLFMFIFNSNIMEIINGYVDSFLYARGSGTVESRFSIYSLTLKDFVNNPVFGWGSERDTPFNNLPLGSHSYYLALLYRYGLVGLFLYTLIIGRALISLMQPRNRITKLFHRDEFIGYALWVIITGLVDGLFTVPILDLNTIILFWFIVILARTSQRDLHISH